MALRTLTLRECTPILEEIQAKSADYSWIWQACTGHPSPTEAYAKAREQVDPERPYFFGELASGIRFAGDARDFSTALHALYPACNSTLISGLIEELGERSGDVIDAGANIGIVAASLARHLNGRGHVHAFEPSPSTFEVAAATLALNGFPNVTLTEAAIGETNDDIAFFATPGNSSIASVRQHNFPFLNDWLPIKVSCRTIDQLIQQGMFKDLLLVKIDVEGHELSAIRGAADAIRRFSPTVVYEYTPVAASEHGWTDQDSIALLSGFGATKFRALIEPPLDRPGVDGLWTSFPLPEGMQNQVNVFARCDAL